MTMERTPPKGSESLSDQIWYLSRWGLGGALLIIVAVGTVFLAMLTFELLKNAGSPWMGLAAGAAVAAMGFAGHSHLKGWWILKVIPDGIQSDEPAAKD